MRKKTKVIIAVLLVVFVLIGVFAGSSEKGMIVEFIDDAVIIASKDGKKVTRYEEYHSYIPTGEQLSVGDKVVIRGGLFRELSIQRLME